MDTVRFGIIGVGNMGTQHARELYKGRVPGASLAAVCDVKPDRLEWARSELSKDLPTFDDAEKLLTSGLMDAVIIATPHYDHPPLAIRAFELGLHVLCEKPAGVYTKQVRPMNAAAEASGRKFAIMFQQRTYPVFHKVKELIDAGELGELRRMAWTATGWYRPQFYYDSGGWRATWAGEGGGVLMNQCPHNLDLWQWMFGLPVRVQAICRFGKYHKIEVEDEVFATMEYENGAIGTFMTSTGEAPGTNRLEVFGNRGKLTTDGNSITFQRTRVPITEHLATSQDFFAEPESWECAVPHNKWAAVGHNEIIRNFCEAVTKGTPLLTPGAEGIRSLELINAMLLSEWTGEGWVDLPVDEDLYYEQLQQRVRTSTFEKNVVERTADDMGGSYT